MARKWSKADRSFPRQAQLGGRNLLYCSERAPLPTPSPALNDVRAKPLAVISVGFCVSTAQCCTVPSSPVTSNFRKQCGFVQTHCVTVPFNVSCLSAVYNAVL